MTNESEYLEFKEIEYPGKTRYVHVISKKHGFLLGVVRWYGAWRQYVFYPQEETLFNRTCLREIAAFLEQLMEERTRKV